MPRKAAIASGNVDAERAPAHAYIVFGSRTSSVYALQLNMSEASLQAPQHLLTITASCTFHIPAYYLVACEYAQARTQAVQCASLV